MPPFRFASFFFSALAVLLALSAPAQAQQEVFDRALAADTAEDYALAHRLHSQSCEAQFAASCRELAVFQYQGRGTPKNDALARTTATQACRLGAADGCGLIAQFAFEGVGGPTDLGLIRRLGETACTQAANTTRLCLYYGLALMKEETEQKNYDAAKAAFLIACKGSYAAGCLELGLVHIGYYGGEPNMAEAEYFVGHACIRGEERACRMLESTPVDFLKVATEACNEGHPPACRTLQRPE